MSKIRVAVIDDHSVCRAGLRFILGEAGDMEIVGEYSSGENAAVNLAGCAADVVLLDVRMPGKDGIETLKEIRASDIGAKIKVVMLTTSETEEDVVQAMRAKADGYALKDLPPDELVAVIRGVVNDGRKYMSVETADIYASHSLKPELSPREREILEGIAAGLDNGELAKAFNVSRETIKMHIRHIFQKLEVVDRTEAVVAAAKRGILKGFS